MAELAREGVGMCTCSSIGGAAEAAASTQAPVVRIDRALMEAALEHGNRPLVAMCLESTRVPTMDLLADVASKAGMRVAPQVIMCEGAWPHFEAGEMNRYANVIVQAIDPVAEASKPDCIVLAQASMAPAEPLLKELGLPVLSSPRLGVLKALKLFGAAKSLPSQWSAAAARSRTMDSTGKSRRQWWLLLVVTVLIAVAVGVIGYTYAKRYFLNETQARGEVTLRLAVASISSALERYERLPQLLADRADIRRVLANPSGKALRDQLSMELQRVNTLLGSSDIYVLDRTGLTLSASNHQLPTSFVGQSYNYRPYFT